ncbi:retrovirus-related pol polyprotein from transposon TNT 1-94, partial [Tanacetum coccineum]
MSTQQDIYAAGSENLPPMLNQENYVPWSSRLLRYAKSRPKPNGKLIYNSIMHGPYTDEELTEKELKQVEADDQAIQTILMGLPEDIYAAVDSCEITQEIWLRVQQMMKGSDIRIQDKKAKLFNEWEMFTSTDRESIESYYHRFSKLMNDFKRNKHFPKKIASNIKFLNNLQLEWRRHVTIVHQTKDLHEVDYTQLYDFLKYNQIAQPGINLGQDRQMKMVGGNDGNQFRQYARQNIRNQNGYNTVWTIRNQNGNGNVVAARAEGNANGNNGNQIRCYNCRGLGHLARNCTVRPRRRDAAYLQTQLLIAQKEEAGIQLQAEEFDLMAAAADLDEIEEVNANCILMANLQQASTSGTQTDKAPVYDSDGSAEVQLHDKCYNDEIFNMFTQEEQYTELLEPIPEPHQVPQNDSNVISEVSSVEQGGGTIEQHHVTVEETRAYQESSLLNLVAEVEKVNMVNCKMRETNAKLTTELARYKNQEKCFEISQEKYDNLERCYQQSVYQEQCLTKKINAFHLSSGKQITALNEEILNLNKQLSKENSTVSSLLEEKKRLKSDFKICEDELLDKQVQLENNIKELDNILVKIGQSIQTMHMLSPKSDSFYHSEHKMALGYQNPFYLKQAQQKQQSLYNGKVLLEKHDPPVVYDLEETLQLAQESRLKMKQLNKEIKPTNYTKINHLLGIF